VPRRFDFLKAFCLAKHSISILLFDELQFAFALGLALANFPFFAVFLSAAAADTDTEASCFPL